MLHPTRTVWIAIVAAACGAACSNPPPDPVNTMCTVVAPDAGVDGGRITESCTKETSDGYWSCLCTYSGGQERVCAETADRCNQITGACCTAGEVGNDASADIGFPE